MIVEGVNERCSLCCPLHLLTCCRELCVFLCAGSAALPGGRRCTINLCKASFILRWLLYKSQLGSWEQLIVHCLAVVSWSTCRGSVPVIDSSKEILTCTSWLAAFQSTSVLITLVPNQSSSGWVHIKPSNPPLWSLSEFVLHVSECSSSSSRSP